MKYDKDMLYSIAPSLPSVLGYRYQSQILSLEAAVKSRKMDLSLNPNYLKSALRP